MCLPVLLRDLTAFGGALLLPRGGRLGVDGVCSRGAEAARSAVQAGEQDLRGLLTEEPPMGVRVLRNLHVFGVLGKTSRARRAHQFRPIRDDGLLVGDTA